MTEPTPTPSVPVEPELDPALPDYDVDGRELPEDVETRGPAAGPDDLQDEL